MYEKHLPMNKFIIIIITFLILPMQKNVFAQKVFSVQHEYQADIKVYQTNDINKADLVVYKVNYESKATKDGLWYFTDYDYQAKKRIFFTNEIQRADLTVFFTENMKAIGWRKKSKQHLLY